MNNHKQPSATLCSSMYRKLFAKIVPCTGWRNRSACRSAKCRRARPGFEIVGAGCAAEWHIEMRMHINAARKNILSHGFQHSCGILPRQILSDDFDLACADCNVG